VRFYLSLTRKRDHVVIKIGGIKADLVTRILTRVIAIVIVRRQSDKADMKGADKNIALQLLDVSNNIVQPMHLESKFV
jgi:hypothetical protein